MTLLQSVYNPVRAFPADPDYLDKLRTLSDGSVRRNFDPYRDIDWDADELRVDPTDSRWILAEYDPFGRHPWYRTQPVEKQIEIGIWRYANVARVGIQFESMLIRGIQQYAMKLPNGSPEFRYVMHEAAEECNHTMMFQEFINRTGVDAPGAPRWVRMISPLIPFILVASPPFFWAAVLAGEEPIDHQQKDMLRGSDQGHPLFVRVMAIHVAEEARHISFAHEHLQQYVPQLSRPHRWVLSAFLPIAMRLACDFIIKPARAMRTEFGVPRRVMREIYWRRPESREVLSEYFADVRMLAERLGLMNPGARLIWKALKISGDVARYRSQPASDRAAA